MKSIVRWLGAALALALLVLPVGPADAGLSSKEFKAAEKKLKVGLATNDIPSVIDAIAELGKDDSKKAVELLVKVGAALEDHRVYDAIKDSLQGMDEAAVPHMLKTLKKGSAGTWQLRCVLLEGLIPHQGEEVTSAMADRLEDKVPYVISMAAKALAKRKDPLGVPALIDALEELEKNKDVPWEDTKQALTDITGEDFPESVAWRDYWKAVGPNFDPEKDRGDKSKSTTVLREDETSQFFKEKIVAKRIMFVIDVSGSMEQEDPPTEAGGGGKRIERVKAELMRTISGLRKDVSFNVLAYSDVLKSWKKIDKGTRLLKATNSNKADAVKWVQGLKAMGMTHTDDALKKSFDLIEVNSIVILSDGAPAKVDKQTGQQQQVNPDDILNEVKGMNRLRGVKIYSFCFKVFEGNPGAEPLLNFMRSLAEDNGGKMTLIP